MAGALTATRGTLVPAGGGGFLPFDFTGPPQRVSASFNGSNQYLSAPATGTRGTFIFTGDFTVEAWFYPTNLTGTHTLFSLGTEATNRYNLALNGATINSNLFGSSSVAYTTSGASLSTSTWYHIALVRSGSTVTVYVNGTADATTDTQAGTIGNGVVRVGANGSGGGLYQGSMSNFRTAATAVYTGNFTPPTKPLPLVSYTTLGGSAAFNGSQLQALTIPANAAFATGTNNFTIEYWLNQYYRGPYDSPFGYTSAAHSFYWPIGTSQNFPYMSGTGTWSITGGTLPPLNSWNHYALVRNGTTMSYYLNGVLVGTTTANFNLDSPTSPIVIGAQANSAGTNVLFGNITNFRWVNGLAVYTSAFTPPTAALTAISATATSIAGGSLSFTTRGTTSVATYATLSPAITFGTSSWTIEAFVYFNDTGVQNIIGTSATPGMMFYFQAGTGCSVQNNYGQAISWSYNYALNTWYHVAASYDGTYVNVWVNGNQLATGRQAWSNGSFATGNQIASNSWSGASAYGSNMSITNLRVVVGSTVYATSSTTITVPTAQLTVYNSVNNSGSAQFNGSNYLSSSVPFSMGTGAYTVECFVYLTATVSSTAAILGATVAGGSNGFSLAIANMTTIQTDRSGSASNQYTIPTLTLNTWHHIVVTRSSTISQETVFVDGVKSSTGYGSAQNYAGSTGYLGSFGGSAWPFTGYISQLRVVVGSNVYDPTQSTITVPTSALTSVANTKLLLLFASSAALLTDTSGTQTMTNTGSVAWSQTGPFSVNVTQLLMQVNASGTAFTDTAGITTVTNVGGRATYSSTPYSYGAYSTALLLNTTDSAGLLTDSSANNFTVTNSLAVAFSSSSPLPSVRQFLLSLGVYPIVDNSLNTIALTNNGIASGSITGLSPFSANWVDSVSGIVATVGVGNAGQPTYTSSYGGGINVEEAVRPYVDVPTTRTGVGGYTISMLANIPTAPSHYVPLFTGNNLAVGSGGRSGNYIYARKWTNFETGSFASPTTNIDLNFTAGALTNPPAWYDFVYNGTSVTVYRNAQLITSFTMTAAAGWSSPLRFAGDESSSTGNSMAIGTLYRMKHQTTALSSSGISAQFETVRTLTGGGTLAGSLSFPGGVAGTRMLDLSTGFTLGAGSYTVEGWFQLPDFANQYALFGANASAGDGTGMMNLIVSSSTNIFSDKNGGGGSFSYTVPTMSANTWYHFALTRNGTTEALFINGVRCGATQTNALNYTAATTRIGMSYVRSWPGLMTNMRVVVGSYVYDPAFSFCTVPIGPLTFITNTKYLMTGADPRQDASNFNNITNTGSVTTSASKPF